MHKTKHRLVTCGKGSIDEYKCWLDPRYLNVLKETLTVCKNEHQLTAYSIHCLIEAYREYIMGYVATNTLRSFLCGEYIGKRDISLEMSYNSDEQSEVGSASPSPSPSPSLLLFGGSFEIDLPLDIVDLIVSYTYNVRGIIQSIGKYEEKHLILSPNSRSSTPRAEFAGRRSSRQTVKWQQTESFPTRTVAKSPAPLPLTWKKVRTRGSGKKWGRFLRCLKKWRKQFVGHF